MKKFIKRLFTVIIGLSIVLGMDKLTYAAEPVTVDKTTPEITLNIQNDGLAADDEVTAEVKVKFDKTTTVATIQIALGFDETNLTYEEWTSASTPVFSNVNVDSTNAADGALLIKRESTQDVTCDNNVDGIVLGTITFKLKKAMVATDKLEFEIEANNLTGFADQENNKWSLDETIAIEHPMGKPLNIDETSVTLTVATEGCECTCGSTRVDLYATLNATNAESKAVSTKMDSYSVKITAHIEDVDFLDFDNATEDGIYKATYKVSSDDGEQRLTFTWNSDVVGGEEFDFNEPIYLGSIYCKADEKFDLTVSEAKFACGDDSATRVLGNDTLSCTAQPAGTTEGTFKQVGDTIPATADNLGGRATKCTVCGRKEFVDLNRTGQESEVQINMPSVEDFNDCSIYDYCKWGNPDLFAETTVTINGEELKVILADPLDGLRTDKEKKAGCYLGLNVSYVDKDSAPERYEELVADRDTDHEAENLIFLEVNPVVYNSDTTQRRVVSGELTKEVYMEYQVPKGWDADEIEIVLVDEGEDIEHIERVLTFNEGTPEEENYIVLWKNHFSPYAVIDKLTDNDKTTTLTPTNPGNPVITLDNLTDEQKAALNIDNLTEEEKAELNKLLEEAAKENSANNSGNVKTGDDINVMLMTSLSMLIIAALFISVCLKKKRV